MGRRALRKLDPNLDLSRHYLELAEMAKPLHAADVFDRDAPLEIEVGSGKGLFLQTAAERQPEIDFLGIEIANKYARFIAARLARRALTNARIICGDAGQFFREWVTDQSVQAVHVYFPDPWWKKRHKKRRVMNEAFVREIERVLRVGGRLHFWSDVEEYYLATIEMLTNLTKLDGPQVEQPAEPEHDLDFRTHFERRFRLTNQPVYRALFVK